MVQGRLRLVVGKPIEVPVRVAAEHDGRRLGRGHGNHANVPVHAVEGVRHVRDDLAGEALLAVGVDNGEGDAAVGVRHDGEVAPAPAVLAAVQADDAVRVLLSRMFVGGDVVRLAVNLKGAVLDAVGVPARDVAIVGMLPVERVVRGVVPAGDNVTLDAMLVLDEQVRDGGAVRDKTGFDAVAVDPVLAILVWLWLTRVPRRNAEGRQSDHGSEAEKLSLQMHFVLHGHSAAQPGQLGNGVREE